MFEGPVGLQQELSVDKPALFLSHFYTIKKPQYLYNHFLCENLILHFKQPLVCTTFAAFSQMSSVHFFQVFLILSEKLLML